MLIEHKLKNPRKYKNEKVPYKILVSRDTLLSFLGPSLQKSLSVYLNVYTHLICFMEMPMFCYKLLTLNK